MAGSVDGLTGQWIIQLMFALAGHPYGDGIRDPAPCVALAS